VALSVVYEPEDAAAIAKEWEEYGFEVPLRTVESPYRELVRPVLRFIDELQAEHPGDTVAVMIPEFVVSRWWEHILHNQSALVLKARLLFREGTVVVSVPYHLRSAPKEEPGPLGALTAVEEVEATALDGSAWGPCDDDGRTPAASGSRCAGAAAAIGSADALARQVDQAR
jgi:hypothetical protein